MHAFIPRKETSRAPESGTVLADPRAPLVPNTSPHAIAAACPARVLAVGRMEADVPVREPLGQSLDFCFFHANDYRDLWRLSRGNTYDAVVFHNSLSCFELEEAARLVRRRWPSAKILLIRSGEITLEDPLYDYRLRPPVDPNTLLSFLSGQPHPNPEPPRQRWRMAPALGN